MENNYYTPTLEYLHVGYECERQDWKKRWYKTKLRDDDWGDLAGDIDREIIRTPYLIREQIEGEGWRKETTPFNDWFEPDAEDIFEEGFVKDHDASTENIPKWFVIRWLDSHWLNIEYRYYTNMTSWQSLLIFNGNCPSINEFRKIIKLLGI